jgi:peroxiredoxin
MPSAIVLDENEQNFDITNLPNDFLVVSVIRSITDANSIKQSHRLNQEAKNLPEVTFVTISTNLMTDIKTWALEEELTEFTLLSDVNKDFGQVFDIYHEDEQYDQNSVFIFDQNKNLVYQEIIDDGANPNYDAEIGNLKLMMD